MKAGSGPSSGNTCLMCKTHCTRIACAGTALPEDDAS